MPKSVIELPLAHSPLGTGRTLATHRYGLPGARPKVYVQAGLHASEIPPMLVADRLIALLDEAEAKGEIKGEIIVVPFCNPIGLGQVVQGELLGRFALDGSGNFNRGFPDLAPQVARRLKGALGPDAGTNVALIRKALHDAATALSPDNPVDALRATLLRLAIDSDIVLDLHCDNESVMHLYTGTELWPAAADLAAETGALAVLLAEVSGGDPFDEACSGVWWRLRDILGEDGAPIPAACLAATIEYRGRADVAPDLAEADAEALVRFLRRRRVLSGDPGPLPEALCEATPLAGVERLTAPVAGVLAFHRRPGDRVRAGDLVAEVVVPGRSRHPLHAGADGILYSRPIIKLAAAGEDIAAIAGARALKGAGAHLLTD